MIDDETKLVRMIAVNDLDIHTRVSHSPSDHAQLAGNVLPQLLHENLADIDDLDTDVFERFAGSLAVLEQKMHVPDAIHHPTATTFDTYAGSTECLAHPGHLARPVF